MSVGGSPWWRVVLGFLVAPPVATAGFVFGDGATHLLASPDTAMVADYASDTILIAVLFVYPTALLVGIPAYWLFRRSGLGLVPVSLAGGVIAVAPWALIAPSDIGFLTPILLSGILAGAVFWCVAVMGSEP